MHTRREMRQEDEEVQRSERKREATAARQGEIEEEGSREILLQPQPDSRRAQQNTKFCRHIEKVRDRVTYGALEGLT